MGIGYHVNLKAAASHLLAAARSHDGKVLYAG